MKQISFLLILGCTISSFYGCKKDKTPEDYIVRVGNQAFGVYLNGQPWIADYRDAGINYGPLDITMWWNPVDRWNYLTIDALKANEKISLYIPPPIVAGRIALNKTTLPHPSVLDPPAYGMYQIYSPSKRYMTSETVTGYIDIISCDTTRNHIEGRFEFEAINTSTNEKVTISNGYFKKQIK
jgi:Family of unknown function (DUF6252)